MNSLKLYTIIFAIFPIFGIQSKLYTSSKKQTYFISTSQFTWNEANLECNKQGMALLTIDSQEKFEEISQLFVKEPLEKFGLLWIGAAGVNPAFAWTSTGKPILPSIWATGFPVQQKDANCVHLSNLKPSLGNQICSEKHGFACEERHRAKSCCDKKTNIVLSVKQNN